MLISPSKTSYHNTSNLYLFGGYPMSSSGVARGFPRYPLNYLRVSYATEVKPDAGESDECG